MYSWGNVFYHVTFTGGANVTNFVGVYEVF